MRTSPALKDGGTVTPRMSSKITMARPLDRDLGRLRAAANGPAAGADRAPATPPLTSRSGSRRHPQGDRSGASANLTGRHRSLRSTKLCRGGMAAMRDARSHENQYLRRRVPLASDRPAARASGFAPTTPHERGVKRGLAAICIGGGSGGHDRETVWAPALFPFRYRRGGHIALMASAQIFVPVFLAVLAAVSASAQTLDAHRIFRQQSSAWSEGGRRIRAGDWRRSLPRPGPLSSMWRREARGATVFFNPTPAAATHPIDWCPRHILPACTCAGAFCYWCWRATRRRPTSRRPCIENELTPDDRGRSSTAARSGRCGSISANSQRAGPFGRAWRSRWLAIPGRRRRVRAPRGRPCRAPHESGHAPAGASPRRLTHAGKPHRITGTMSWKLLWRRNQRAEPMRSLAARNVRALGLWNRPVGVMIRSTSTVAPPFP